jgi:hypothetical protein
MTPQNLFHDLDTPSPDAQQNPELSKQKRRSKEIDLEALTFSHQCPRCKFEFSSRKR